MRNWTRSDAALTGLMLLLALIVLGFQSRNTGFWGIKHGWTSSHGLAILNRATPENRFVGYSLQYRDENGDVSYDYFDRYPVFFSVAMNALLSVTGDLPGQVALARQLMNLIFLATMFVAYRLVCRFVENRFLALAVVTLAFSSYYLLYYKDMVHFDQPALLGQLLLIDAIARYKLAGKRVQLYVVAVIALSLGRGYASFFTLGLWIVLEVMILLFDRDVTWRQKIPRFLRHDAVWVTALALAWGILMLGYNTSVEAWQRDRPLVETSIVGSALRRLPLIGDQGDMADEGLLVWGKFAVVQFERLAQWSLPLKMGGPTGTEFLPTLDPVEVNPLLIVAGAGMLLFVIFFVVRQRSPLRETAILLAFGGLLWVFFMINLSTTHEYVTMYGVGFAIVFYLAALRFLERRPVLVGVALVLSIGLFGASNWQVRGAQVDEMAQSAVYTEDFNRILHAIDGRKNNIHSTYSSNCIIRQSMCFVLGYFLGDNYLSPYEVADYVLSPFPYHTSEPFLEPDDTNGLTLLAHPLTPQNRTGFLFDTRQAQSRTIPEDARALFRFGDALTFQHWRLDGPVTVSACDRVVLETWWLAEDILEKNYSMLWAMVAENGQSAVADANSPLSYLATKVWVPGTYVLDARTLVVPCDTPPGEYPLVISVYDPADLASLPVTTADGTPSGQHVYLTTLFVDS